MSLKISLAMSINITMLNLKKWKKKPEAEMEDRSAELSGWGYLGGTSMILRVSGPGISFS